jgi:hypothetical protein
MVNEAPEAGTSFKKIIIKKRICLYISELHLLFAGMRLFFAVI